MRCSRFGEPTNAADPRRAPPRGEDSARRHGSRRASAPLTTWCCLVCGARRGSHAHSRGSDRRSRGPPDADSDARKETQVLEKIAFVRADRVDRRVLVQPEIFEKRVEMLSDHACRSSSARAESACLRSGFRRGPWSSGGISPNAISTARSLSDRRAIRSRPARQARSCVAGPRVARRARSWRRSCPPSTLTPPTPRSPPRRTSARRRTDRHALASATCTRSTVGAFTWQTRSRDDLFFAGQMSGVEGSESAASGLMAGRNAASFVLGEPLAVPPRTTALGALAYYVSHADPKHYVPSNIAFGLMPPLDEGRDGSRTANRRFRRERSRICRHRREHLDTFLDISPAERERVGPHGPGIQERFSQLLFVSFRASEWRQADLEDRQSDPREHACFLGVLHARGNTKSSAARKLSAIRAFGRYFAARRCRRRSRGAGGRAEA